MDTRDESCGFYCTSVAYPNLFVRVISIYVMCATPSSPYLVHSPSWNL